ncbi:MAG: RNA polymerase-binding protein RbpA [Propionibacteriaceae bacterium]|jgi:hypothetical protein|nr:RNA polymerase-binding protein RbpA [Propionibacteriaceae bacterium]
MEMAPRKRVEYYCPNGHDFVLTLLLEAEVSEVWDCPRCSAPARTNPAQLTNQADNTRNRTPWDMLRERRGIPELEQLLREQLKELRAA